jgi:hypothetical protein
MQFFYWRNPNLWMADKILVKPSGAGFLRAYNKKIRKIIHIIVLLGKIPVIKWDFSILKFYQKESRSADVQYLVLLTFNSQLKVIDPKQKPSPSEL